MFKRILGYLGIKNKENGENSVIPDENVVISDVSRETGEKLPIQEYLGDSENKKFLLGEISVEEVRKGVIEGSIGEYRENANEKRKAIEKERKEILNRRMSVNEEYMMERFGIKPKRRTMFGFPNFMAANFSGFLIGKSVEDGKFLIFAGLSDVQDRNVVVGKRVLTYSAINSYISSGGVRYGYMWYRVSNVEELRVISGGEFVDEASRVWLLDYFNYLDFIRGWRERNPGLKIDINELNLRVINSEI
jgi:hypothetical protein